MTPGQCLVIALATQAGAKHNSPLTPGVIYHESKAGKYLVGDHGTRFGLGHMSVDVAKETLQQNPLVWPKKYKDEEIIVKLLTDHWFAAELVALRVKKVGLKAYNAGVRGASIGRGRAYEEKVMKDLQEAKKCEDKKHEAKS